MNIEANTRARTSKAAKLLFHGTSALAAWCSFMNSRNAAGLSRDLSAQRQKIAKRFGPIYPRIDLIKTETCLADNLGEAFSFAIGWKIRIEPQRITLASHTSYINNDRLLAPSPDPQVAKVLDQLAWKAAPPVQEFPSPGAILIVDGSGLAQNNLLAPKKGEESVIAKYLPWSFVRGILLVSRYPGQEKTERKISAYGFFDNKVGPDLIKHLIRVSDNQFLFTAEGLRWVPSALSNYP